MRAPAQKEVALQLSWEAAAGPLTRTRAGTTSGVFTEARHWCLPGAASQTPRIICTAAARSRRQP